MNVAEVPSAVAMRLSNPEAVHGVRAAGMTPLRC
jgi:hypothetical protein